MFSLPLLAENVLASCRHVLSGADAGDTCDGLELVGIASLALGHRGLTVTAVRQSGIGRLAGATGPDSNRAKPVSDEPAP